MATTQSRWARRPVLTVVVRVLVVMIPITVGVVAGAVVSRILPQASGFGELLWWAAVLGAATAAMLAGEALARRLLPLSILLRLTMAFPDRAPSRLRVALKATNVRRMQERVNSDAHAELAPAERAVDLVALAAALSAHDRRTRGHSHRVQALTALVADQMNLESDERERLEWASFLHDIGKLEVPSAVLNKPGKPDEAEWAMIRRHPEEGAHLVGPLRPWLGDAMGAIGEHHEKFDGTGYPRGLAGEDISRAGRIVAVTDAFETITANRSYKRALAPQKARAELTRCAGTHFDPQVVRAFLGVSLGRLRWVIGIASWIALIPLVGSVPRARAAVLRPSFAGAGCGLAGAALAAAVLAGGTTQVAAPVTGGPGTEVGPGGSRASRIEATAVAVSNVVGAAHGSATASESGSDAAPSLAVIVQGAGTRVSAGLGGAMVEPDQSSSPSVMVETPGTTLHAP